MGHRRRFIICMLLGAVFAGQLPSASAGEDAHLSEATTIEAPANGGDLLLDSLVGFQPGAGTALIEPGTAHEETITYQGIGSDPTRLFGIERSNPLDHPEGATVVPTSTHDTSAESETSPSPESSTAASSAANTSSTETAGSSPADAGPAPTPSALQAVDNQHAASPARGSSGDGTAGSLCLQDGAMACVPPECRVAIDTPEGTGNPVVDAILACVRALATVNIPCSSATTCLDYLGVGPFNIPCNSVSSCEDYFGAHPPCGGLDCIPQIPVGAPCLDPNAPDGCAYPPPDCDVRTNSIPCLVWTAVALQPPIIEIGIDDVTEVTDDASGLSALIGGSDRCYMMHIRSSWRTELVPPHLVDQTIMWVNTRFEWCTRKIGGNGYGSGLREIAEPTTTTVDSWVWAPARVWLGVADQRGSDQCEVYYGGDYWYNCGGFRSDGLFQIEVGVGPAHPGLQMCYWQWIYGLSGGHGPKGAGWKNYGPCDWPG